MNISIELPNDIDNIWNDVLQLTRKNNVSLLGDKKKGSFSIKGFNATYIINGRTLTASAEKVPFFLTEKKIKELIQKWFISRDYKKDN